MLEQVYNDRTKKKQDGFRIVADFNIGNAVQIINFGLKWSQFSKVSNDLIFSKKHQRPGGSYVLNATINPVPMHKLVH